MQGTSSGSTTALGARQHWFTLAEWRRLAGFYSVIILLHALGWGFFLFYSARYPALIGLGLTAYLFGLRHAFDADHIAAVDDSIRFMIRSGEKPLGTGFFFSLGHSTIVFTLAAIIIFSATAVKSSLPTLEHAGGLIGASVSGVFLCFIGILNLLVLLDIVKVWRGMKTRTHNHTHVAELLAKRGLINRLFGHRMQKHINRSWHLYPLGLLFGLGFDTATEVALLAMTAAASAIVLPPPAVLSLPLLFTAGMTIMDTTDGVLMCKAYDWAFINPTRKIFYNLVTTGLGVVVALLIGTIELLQVVIATLNLHGPFYDWIAGLGAGAMGYIIVALFLLAWTGSVVLWRLSGGDGSGSGAQGHEHHHADGLTHSHFHFH